MARLTGTAPWVVFLNDTRRDPHLITGHLLFSHAQASNEEAVVLKRGAEAAGTYHFRDIRRGSALFWLRLDVGDRVLVFDEDPDGVFRYQLYTAVREVDGPTRLLPGELPFPYGVGP